MSGSTPSVPRMATGFFLGIVTTSGGLDATLLGDARRNSWWDGAARLKVAGGNARFPLVNVRTGCGMGSVRVLAQDAFAPLASEFEWAGDLRPPGAVGSGIRPAVTFLNQREHKRPWDRAAGVGTGAEAVQ